MMRTFSRTEQARQYVVGLLFGLFDRCPKRVVDIALLASFTVLAFLPSVSDWLNGYGFGVLQTIFLLCLVLAHDDAIRAVKQAEWRTFVGYLPRHGKLYKVKLLMPPEINTKEKAIANIKGQW